MASYESIRTLSGIAGEALTVYRCVTLQADGEFDQSSAGDWPHGICAESVAAQGDFFPYVVADGGTAKIEAGAAIAINAELEVSTDGVVITAATASTAVIGRAMSAAAASGDIIEIQFLGKPEDFTA